jgi:PPOX class probable F420-dependent enzyme
MLLWPSPIPPTVRALFDRPNYVHLTTLRHDGSPRNWVVWVGVEGEHLLVCTGTGAWKAKDMLRDPRVALSVADFDDPYKMAAAQGRVIQMRRDADNAVMDRIAYKYTSKPFPHRGEDRVAFVIEIERAGERTFNFEHQRGALDEG